MREISEHAVVETDAIGNNVRILEFCVIRAGVRMGNNVVIHPHVVIESGVVIEEGVEIFPGSYIGKTPKGAGATSRPIAYTPSVRIGKDCAIGPNAVIFYDVDIGHNTLVGDCASIREQGRIGHHCVIGPYVTLNYNAAIGNRTKVIALSHITGNCRIGDDVFIGVLVSTANDNDLVSRQYREDMIGPTICNRASIGNGATILPGVTIGEGAFVGASALVSRNVPPWKMVLGSPARVVKDLRGAEGTERRGLFAPPPSKL
jgi:acetyltransferase-like isoleucine patch superfamily enzyme